MRCAKCGVVVLQASMLYWGGSICHGYMCIVLYLNLIWCNGFTDIYASLEVGGVNLPCVYMYCTIYKLVWCNGFPDTYD